MTSPTPHPSVLLEATALVVDYDAVRVGEELPPVSFTVTRQDVEDYRDAVGTAETRPVIAIMHLLAITLAAITERMPLPSTCVHVGQELEWSHPVEAEATIDVRFALVSRRTAAGSTLSAFSLHLSHGEIEVARGRILLTS